MNHIQELLQYHRAGHSDLQIDRFIIARSGCTTYGMFKQTLRELSSRRETLNSQWLDAEEAKLELADLENAQRKAPCTRTNIALIRARIRRDGREAAFMETMREFWRFFQHGRELHRRLTAEGPLTVERIEQLDREEWSTHLRRNAAIEVAVYGNETQSTLDAIACLEPAQRLELLGRTQKRDDERHWLENYESEVPQIPHAPVPFDEIKAMISDEIARYGLISNEMTPLAEPRPPPVMMGMPRKVSDGWPATDGVSITDSGSLCGLVSSGASSLNPCP